MTGPLIKLSQIATRDAEATPVYVNAAHMLWLELIDVWTDIHFTNETTMTVTESPEAIQQLMHTTPDERDGSAPTSTARPAAESTAFGGLQDIEPPPLGTS
jgi:hypothetical protein